MFQNVNMWQQILDEHRRAKTYVGIVCGWAVSRHRDHFPQVYYVATSFLKTLNTHLQDLFSSVEGLGSSATNAFRESTPSLAETESQDAKVSEPEDYALQSFLEDFIDNFIPEQGAEEAEMLRLERLLGELMRAKLFDHDHWLHGLMAKGIFEAGVETGEADFQTKKHYRCVLDLSLPSLCILP